MSRSPGMTTVEVESANEVLIGRIPVTVRRRVKWGECDPAGVVYMANYGEYVISAYEMGMAVLLDGPFQKAKLRLGVALPAKAFAIEFVASLRPDDDFTMTVEIAEIRTRTFDVRVCGRTMDRRDLFSAKLTPIAVQPIERSAVALPEALVRELRRYRDACEAIAPAPTPKE